MYLINMPLYVVHELRLPERLAGILMGAAAGLEIPIMLLAGLAAKHCGKRRLMRGAVVAGVLFYCGLLFITGSWQLIALQLLNAAFIGVLAGIGMLYFQDLMPGGPGRHHAVHQHHPGGLDHRRLNRRRGGGNLELPCGVLRRAGDDGGGHAVPVAVERRLGRGVRFQPGEINQRLIAVIVAHVAARLQAAAHFRPQRRMKQAAAQPFIRECSGYWRACRSACRGSGWILTARYSRRRSRCDSPSALLRWAGEKRDNSSRVRWRQQNPCPLRSLHSSSCATGFTYGE